MFRLYHLNTLCHGYYILQGTNFVDIVVGNATGTKIPKRFNHLVSAVLAN